MSQRLQPYVSEAATLCALGRHLRRAEQVRHEGGPADGPLGLEEQREEVLQLLRHHLCMV